MARKLTDATAVGYESENTFARGEAVGPGGGCGAHGDTRGAVQQQRDVKDKVMNRFTFLPFLPRVDELLRLTVSACMEKTPAIAEH